MEKVYILEGNKGSYDSYIEWIESIHKTKEGIDKALKECNKKEQDKLEIYNKYEEEFTNLVSNISNNSEDLFNKFIEKVSKEIYELISDIHWEGINNYIIIEKELLN